MLKFKYRDDPKASKNKLKIRTIFPVEWIFSPIYVKTWGEKYMRCSFFWLSVHVCLCVCLIDWRRVCPQRWLKNSNTLEIINVNKDKSLYSALISQDFQRAFDYTPWQGNIGFFWNTWVLQFNVSTWSDILLVYTTFILTSCINSRATISRIPARDRCFSGKCYNNIVCNDYNSVAFNYS